MPNYNRVILVGHLTRDPECKYTPKGTAVSNFGLAVNHKYKTDSGGVKEEVYWGEVEVWGSQAEACKEYLAKGRAVLVEGRLKTEQWESGGEKKSRTRIRADRVQFLSSPDSQKREPRREEAPPEEGRAVDESGDDIPF
ncbi:MAG TPA: single-stranded DNA-binding protein [Bryobacteraceae bacterium]|jgi:single-strand DNA-binding protein